MSAVVDSLVNKVCLESLDKKYEEAIRSLLASFGTLTSSLSAQSADQYTGFTTALKDSFGFNMQQIQDTLGTLAEELGQAKDKLQVVGNRVEVVDVELRKGMAEMGDRMQVERLMRELVDRVLLM